MVDVHRLRLLRELSARGTIAATAQACSLTPSAVSQQLAQLQREAGVALLLRDGRRLALTEAGRALVARAERILAEVERAEAELAALSTSASGTVRIGAFPTGASTLVPSAVAAGRSAHPELTALVQQRKTRDGLLALKSGHVALVYECDQLPELADAGMELVPLLTEPLLAALPPSLDNGQDSVRLAELADQPRIAPRAATPNCASAWSGPAVRPASPRTSTTSATTARRSSPSSPRDSAAASYHRWPRRTPLPTCGCARSANRGCPAELRWPPAPGCAAARPH